MVAEREPLFPFSLCHPHYTLTESSKGFVLVR